MKSNLVCVWVWSSKAYHVMECVQAACLGQWRSSYMSEVKDCPLNHLHPSSCNAEHGKTTSRQEGEPGRMDRTEQ